MPSESRSSVQLKFWGVRGSIPVPGQDTLRYGGNTTCVEVRADGEIIVLDAGSGIRSLGLALEREFGTDPIKLSLLITHAHWDHIQGLPFFRPAYEEKNSIRVYGYDGAQTDFSEILAEPMKMPFFPIKLGDLGSRIDIQELKEMEFQIGSVKVCSQFLNHPGVCAGYRLFTSAGSIAFLPDNEPFENFIHSAENNGAPNKNSKIATDKRAKLLGFLQGSDVLILDAQYTDEEYEEHIGWGHGSFRTSVQLALDAQVGRLILFHHDPEHTDDEVDQMLKGARALVDKNGKKMEVTAAREGDELTLGRK